MKTVEEPLEGAAVLAERVARAETVVIFTGAGISTESGIPDFRGPNGLWTKIKPIYYDEFVSSETARREDWKRRFAFRDQVAAVEPNVAHRAIARLIASGKANAVITQNIDGLHGRAGVPADRLIELHGNATYATCLSCDARVELDEAEAIIAATGRTPRCACGGLIKAAVISFGQAMPSREMQRAEEAIQQADLFVAVGSSLTVQPAATLPMIAKYEGAELIIVNAESTPLDGLADRVLRGSIGTVFSRL
ncbi:SIR2 family NAD-dependent protein deacylase [Pinisolibacter aquiterrae]|uniref:SIR2 family NAD-dependent protein deacylase n=1 Tax=Pinisolibacter aquiterrae TaxID=2815579 RepID=UPI001C3CDCA6|nr:Sir2 family NAD-dependent protein deacetylase [Pinisolibacter aquiterrae]MBV5266070.1 NAD-dependent deacetylase [Pinisolibacter aquiterrae]MCC8233637.1 NAD-dependent deacetylase [Pinisolibacter aquiterrae]